MGVGGDEGGICYVGPPAEAEPTVAEGSKGEGGADGVEGVGERRESADDAEQGSVIGGLGAVEGWGATTTLRRRWVMLCWRDLRVRMYWT